MSALCTDIFLHFELKLRWSDGETADASKRWWRRIEVRLVLLKVWLASKKQFRNFDNFRDYADSPVMPLGAFERVPGLIGGQLNDQSKDPKRKLNRRNLVVI